jgi:hypothetical protein
MIGKIGWESSRETFDPFPIHKGRMRYESHGPKGLRLNHEIQSKVERSNCEYHAVPVRNSFSSSADAKREEFLDW